MQSPATCNTSSSDDDTSIAPNSNGSESDPQESQPNVKPGIDDFVVVEYAGKKVVVYHYVGIITGIEDFDFHVKFLKQMSRDSNLKGLEPSDEDTISDDMIVKVLQKPTLCKTGHRSHWKFDEDLSHWKFDEDLSHWKFDEDLSHYNLD